MFPGRRVDRRAVVARTDRALRSAVAELMAGYPVPGVLARLQEATHRGGAMMGKGRRCYDVAVAIRPFV